MKFMKLGSGHDASFCIIGAARTLLPEVSSDLTVEVNETIYLLHKFPLFSKCLRLHKQARSDWAETSGQARQPPTVELPDFPGGLEAFELCTKFCYGYTITLSAHNIVSVRCAAEYLQMTEEIERGNLISKLDTFLNSCIFHGWKDTIVTLQSTTKEGGLQALSEDLRITSRCIDAIASKVRAANPGKANLSRSYSIRGGSNGPESGERQTSKTWWGEDLAELEVDLYWRTMVAIGGGERVRVPANVIGDALRIYASRWLPSFDDFRSEETSTTKSTYKLAVLEAIVRLLPEEKGPAAVSCGFVLQLLKAAHFLGASSSLKVEITRTAAARLEDACVGDLLVPASSMDDETMYDIDMVMNVLEEFMCSEGKSPPVARTRGKGGDDSSERSGTPSLDIVNLDDFQDMSVSSSSSSPASHSSKLMKVAKLFDVYLQEISREDPNLPLSKFTTIAESIPYFARADHDDLYKAIHIYLKSHPELNKSERKRICSTLDCRKLSMEACIHAAQNELLPLRVVVQVLFFEHARAAAMSNGHLLELPSNLKETCMISNDADDHISAKKKLSSPDDDHHGLWSRAASGRDHNKVTLKMKLDEDDDDEIEDQIFATVLKKSSSRCFKIFSQR
ncbi:unnamed protein product [Cuscuta epithymum]|uniref:NPH3 domain-containing protein n=1 Tax=Cuscuta epithymum TaxID=186058 RepID=A0AAV0CGB8_9ASTE|nr:unnamed protein product [Cuscuta epithymum]